MTKLHKKSLSKLSEKVLTSHESQAVDADNDLLISQIQKLLSGTTPAITPLQAQQMLAKRGLI